jgi:hypothetical protein
MLKAKLGFVLVATMAFVAFIGVQGRAGAQATTDTQNFIFPFEADIDVPCAEESVHFSGNLHFSVHTTRTPDGEELMHFIQNPQGVSGVGSVTGDKYQLTGKFSEVRNALPPGQTGTFIAVNHAVGQGPGNNFYTHSNFQFTVNANGELTANFQHITGSCK